MKRIFQMIIPTLKVNITTPLTLLRSFGNWVHRQFTRGIPDRQKQDIGIIIQNTANVILFSLKLIASGESRNTNAQDLIAVRYPTHRAKGLANGTVSIRGTSAQRSSFELVVLSMASP